MATLPRTEHGWRAASRRRWTRRRRSSGRLPRSARGSAGGWARCGSRRPAPGVLGAWRPGARGRGRLGVREHLAQPRARARRGPARAGVGRRARRPGSPTSRATPTSRARPAAAGPACTPPSASRSAARAACRRDRVLHGRAARARRGAARDAGQARRPDRAGGRAPARRRGALRDREARHRAMLDAALDCVITIDDDGPRARVQPRRRAHLRLQRRARRSGARWPS